MKWSYLHNRQVVGADHFTISMEMLLRDFGLS